MEIMVTRLLIGEVTRKDAGLTNCAHLSRQAKSIFDFSKNGIQGGSGFTTFIYNEWTAAA
jgi:hypothetical protein